MQVLVKIVHELPLPPPLVIGLVYNIHAVLTPRCVSELVSEYSLFHHVTFHLICVTAHVHQMFDVGSKVEARLGGGDHWYPGTVRGSNQLCHSRFESQG